MRVSTVFGVLTMEVILKCQIVHSNLTVEIKKLIRSTEVWVRHNNKQVSNCWIGSCLLLMSVSGILLFGVYRLLRRRLLVFGLEDILLEVEISGK